MADADALTFALRTYEGALGGLPMGEAVRAARTALLGTASQPLSFAAYVLYGDPRQALPAFRVQRALAKTRAERTTSAEVRAAPEAAPSRWRRVAVGAALAAALGSAALLWPRPPTSTSTAAPAPLPAVRREGPVRLTVLPFKNVSGDRSLDSLADTIAETLTTELAGADGIRLVERGQIELNLKEIDFGRGEYVDQETRAELGRIVGAEVAVLGGFQRAGEVLRVNARLVDVASGEVLRALKVDAPAGDVLGAQDALAAEVKAALPVLAARVRR